MTTIPRAFTDGFPDLDPAERQDWIDSLRDALRARGPEIVSEILEELQIDAQKAGVQLPVTSQTPYVNTISADRQPPYPGNLPIERLIRSVVRWNAMAMVVEANTKSSGIGGHISTYASAATLYEVGLNHFFRGKDHPSGGDLVFFQGHASPGIYARAYVEGRLSARQMHNFRRELEEGGGLSSYPHPWLMPDFWQFPTVSMGLGPIMAIYQARYMRYLENRGLKPVSDSKVVAFLGDGETDEPETLGAISLASREHLDNLIFVVNCNLQRLDGPVRGNGKIIQELEASFRGAGWNVIKLIWGKEWDELFAKDHDGLLARRAMAAVDGEYQKYAVKGGAYIREHFYGVDERLLKMVEHLSDDYLWHMRLGGHDTEKVFAAYKAAFEHTGSPTVILAKTVKGYGLGEAGEGRNITHQQKKLNEAELLHFRDRFNVPLSDEEVVHAPLYRPPSDSPEMEYMRDRRRMLGGYLPERRPAACNHTPPPPELFQEFLEGTGDREVSTTMAFVRMLTKLLRDDNIGKWVVPIVPDEARTFGMEALFRQFGIYSSVGQLYDPVDSESLMYYKESKDGQILEEGITEAGSMSSFIAAGTAYATYGLCTIPFFIYYSMFGMQRVGDLVWAAADSRTKGFLIGGTAGRTTLAGEGLQHQDGQSHVLASAVPNLLSYDPAYAYEIAVLVEEGIRRMYVENEDVFYYITVGNENYIQPAMPEGAREGILKGMYRLRTSPIPAKPKGPRANLLGSGAILNEVVKAQQILVEKYDIPTDVWAVTSYTQLRREALDVERYNLLNPGSEPQVPYITDVLAEGRGSVFVAASDYMKVLADGIAKWIPGPSVSLGTDGFGRSETRAALRDFFEVDAKHIVIAALGSLAREGHVPAELVQTAMLDLEINRDKPNPMHS
ncbi:MAG TPA: pyruvate dehydrogenase (acetyl-transferring), homodimeric type [Tepidiformaceae bacterium]|nr:pyruvate dehydrogenase (acetyl-transferring), homodimeric type [Tepidiformaceae bacterium]